MKTDIMCYQNVKIQFVISVHSEIKNIEQESEFGKEFEMQSIKTTE